MKSSSYLPVDVDRAYAMGVNTYVVKPVDWHLFQERMRPEHLLGGPRANSNRLLTGQLQEQRRQAKVEKERKDIGKGERHGSGCDLRVQLEGVQEGRNAQAKEAGRTQGKQDA